jgi:hypothetical protein
MDTPVYIVIPWANYIFGGIMALGVTLFIVIWFLSSKGGNKLGAILIIIFGVSFAYILLVAVYPALTSMVTSANASLPADMSAYPAGREIVTAAPWYLFFIPAVIGIVALIITLKAKKN